VDRHQSTLDIVEPGKLKLGNERTGALHSVHENDSGYTVWIRVSSAWRRIGEELDTSEIGSVLEKLLDRQCGRVRRAL
jgi:hypothetical protein